MTSVSSPQDIPVLGLTSDSIALRCAPALGGRVFSLVNRRSGREWLWRQHGTRELFRPSDPADFGSGCFAGLDECVPSVGACRWADGRKVADHGELWAKAWTIDDVDEGGFTLSVESPAFGLRLIRATRLAGSTVRFEYSLANMSSKVAPALWCMHPLFNWLEGDRLELPETVTRLHVQGVQPALPASAPDAAVDGATRSGLRPVIPFPEMLPGVRLDELMLADNDAGFLKAFTDAYRGPVGMAALWNAGTGDRLDVRWDSSAAPYLGLWLTRGGYRGWHHVALEPTTAPHDHVDVAVNDPALSAAVTLAPGERRSWWVEWQVS